MSDKRYYWLRLKEGFFDDKNIKFLRRQPNGDRLVIVYLQMQLKSLKTEGIIKYDKILPSCEEEIALELDEDATIVSSAIEQLLRLGLIEKCDDQSIYMTALQELIGNESDSAERVRKHRERKALHCNTPVTDCNTEIEKEIELDQEKRDIPPISPTGDCTDTQKTQRVESLTVEMARGAGIEKPVDHSTTLVEKRFLEFWQVYPKKVGKGAAEKAFKKTSPTQELFLTILEAVKAQCQCEQWVKDNGQFIPNPATWLNQRRWEDDVQPAQSTSAQSKFAISHQQQVKPSEAYQHQNDFLKDDF